MIYSVSFSQKEREAMFVDFIELEPASACVKCFSIL